MKYIIFLLISMLGGLLQVGADHDPICPYPSHEIIFYPNPSNCSQYLECFEGRKFVMNCPNGLFWNDNAKACDWPGNVDCNAYTYPPTGNTPDPLCPFPSEQITYDINPDNCKQFYECYEGVRYSLTCPDDLYWNHKMNYCDDLENVDCTRGKTTSPSTPPTSPNHDTNISCVGKPNGSYYAHPTDPKKFYECVNGRPIVFTCPAGTEWNEDYLTCVNV